MNISVIDEQKECPTVIKVVGAGGAGNNAVNCMIENNVQLVDFIAVNTDVQQLNKKSKAEIKLAIGNKLTGGLGAGGKPDVGENAALEDREQIANVLRGANLVFITAGMGGGTGTGSAPVIASVAREMGALTVGVVTKPFSFEGKRKMDLAEEGIRKLKESVDALIVIPNQNLLRVVDRKTSIIESFHMSDDVLLQGVKGISDLITVPGLLNMDFADVRTAMSEKGNAVMGIGIGSGETRAVDAATNALNNPLLEDCNTVGATHVLINIAADESLTLPEVEEIANLITQNSDKDALVKWGTTIDPALGQSLKVTLIATGMDYQNSESPIPLSTDEIVAPAPSTKKNEGDYISAAEWAGFQKGHHCSTAGNAEKPKTSPSTGGIGLTPRDSSRDTRATNLDVPTYLRTRGFPQTTPGSDL